jgi:hypothetical protein
MRSMRGAVQGRDTSVRGIISKGPFVQGAQHPRTFSRGHIGRGNINPASRGRIVEGSYISSKGRIVQENYRPVGRIVQELSRGGHSGRGRNDIAPASTCVKVSIGIIYSMDFKLYLILREKIVLQ